MSTLVDHQIRELCRQSGLVEPFDCDLINPASMDVTLGTSIKVEGRICGPESQRVRWREVDITNGFSLPPGNFILAHTEEFIRIPNWVECQFQLKSSRAREGLEHLLAGYIDPGFCGNVTLELLNVNQRHSIELWPGMRIGQLRFNSLEVPPLRSYAVTGRYMNDKGAVPSKG
ncbi:MAG: dCTP deaminase [Candidatus Nanopelagicaceae bacterium]